MTTTRALRETQNDPAAAPWHEMKRQRRRRNAARSTQFVPTQTYLRSIGPVEL